MPECEDCGTPFCDSCGEAYEEAAGCLEEASPFRVDGKVRWHEPVRYGSPREGWLERGMAAPDGIRVS